MPNYLDEDGKPITPQKNYLDEDGNPITNVESFHKTNVASGKLYDLQQPLNIAAQAIRGFTPMAQTVLDINPTTVPISMMLGGAGDLMAQTLEKVGGSRDEISPYSTGASMLANAILPKIKLAEGIASRTSRPGFWNATLSLPEGAIKGYAFSKAGQLGESIGNSGEEKTPEQTGWGEATPALVGGLTSFISSAARIHHLAQQIKDQNYNRSVNKIYAAVEDIPKSGPESEVARRAFNTWFPAVHWFSKATGFKPTNLEELSKLSDAATKTYGKWYDNIVSPIAGRMVPTDEIANDVKQQVLKRYPDMKLKDRLALESVIDKEVSGYRGKYASIQELLDSRVSLNRQLEELQHSQQVGEGQAPGLGKDLKLAQLRAIRNKINSEVDGYYSNDVDTKRLLKDYRDMIDINDMIKSSSQTQTSQNKLKEGLTMPWMVDLASAARRYNAVGAAHTLGGIGISKTAAFFNKPDTLIKSSFDLLDHISPSYDLPIKGNPLPSLKPQLRLPAKGETGEGRLGSQVRVPPAGSQIELTNPSPLERGVEGEVQPSQRYPLTLGEIPLKPKKGEQ